ncbi:hypothetical protein GCM10023086_21530 [Streptomyces venetus]|uniref:Uncharacterized protein n=1 Tax=Streptomyces venetus TaxID=1701086 RepID=A0ABP8FI62_9ACTN
MKMQKGMDNSTKTLIPHHRGVSRNRYTPIRYGAVRRARPAGWARPAESAAARYALSVHSGRPERRDR